MDWILNRISFVGNQLDFNLAYSEVLTNDLDEIQMATIPAKGLENHPSFTLGHICSSYALTISSLGGEYSFKPDWEILFSRKGPGDPRMPERNWKAYPKKEELLNKMREQTEELKLLLKTMKPEDILVEKEWRFNKHFPLMIDYLVFLCVHHIAMHLGQLASWRRGMGLPSALVKL